MGFWSNKPSAQQATPARQTAVAPPTRADLDPLKAAIVALDRAVRGPSNDAIYDALVDVGRATGYGGWTIGSDYPPPQARPWVRIARIIELAANEGRWDVVDLIAGLVAFWDRTGLADTYQGSDSLQSGLDAQIPSVVRDALEQATSRR